MKVLAVVPSVYDTSPGQRFRIEQWEPLLAEQGVKITYAPFETPELRQILYTQGSATAKVRSVLDGLKKRNDDLRDIEEYDVVYVFREAALLGPAWFERKIAKSGSPMVFDFDDAVFVPYKSPSNGYLSYLKFPGKTASICRLSSHVMAGNEYLADYARKYNDKVTIVPTTIDTRKYSPGRENNSEKITIGWSGSFSTVQHLQTISDTLQELAKSENFTLRVIGAADFDLPGVETEAIAWRSDTEVDDLRPIDIGLMPLPDDIWSRGKCALKALQYMALGIPTVCSPVGVNSSIIQDGENGFLADSPQEWIEKLKRLLYSPDLRRSIGDAGRRTVEQGYSDISQVPRILEIFNSVSRRSASKQKA